MAVARPTPTPNPDAMKFTLDITLPGADPREPRRRRRRRVHDRAARNRRGGVRLRRERLRHHHPRQRRRLGSDRVRGRGSRRCPPPRVRRRRPGAGGGRGARASAPTRRGEAPREHRGRDSPQLWSRSRQLTGAAYAASTSTALSSGPRSTRSNARRRAEQPSARATTSTCAPRSRAACARSEKMWSPLPITRRA